jgi:hypothetical protein
MSATERPWRTAARQGAIQQNELVPTNDERAFEARPELRKVLVVGRAIADA